MYNYNDVGYDGWSLNKMKISKLFNDPYCHIGFGNLFTLSNWTQYQRDDSSDRIRNKCNRKRFHSISIT